MTIMTTRFARSPIGFGLPKNSKILKQALLAAMLTSASTIGHSAAAAVGSAEMGAPGTVNAVSENEIARAKGAISHAGYQPVVLEMAQDHNLFFTATKGGETYEVTVTPGARLYVSTGISGGRQS
jgi:hypothetical protein